MAQKIFYGAGQYAAYNLSGWIANGEKPVCFADADERKWNKPFEYYSEKPIEQFYILPLKEAMEKYPDYEIVITVDMHGRAAVYKYLVPNLVKEERVRYSLGDNLEMRKGCSFLGKLWHIAGGYSYTCCYPKRRGVKITCGDDGRYLGSSYKKYREMCHEISEGLRNGYPTSCDGCTALFEGEWETTPILEGIDFGTGFKGDRCNLKCSYCNAKGCLEIAKTDGISAYDFYCEISAFPGFEHVNVNFVNGEPTINPDIDKILNLWKEKRFRGTVATNAVVYNEKLAKLMKEGLAQIICSLDCGTQETYSRIKGVDKFDTVVSNLKKYSGNKKIIMKYILLTGVNDNLADIEGFFEIAHNTNANVYLAGNNFDSNRKMTDSQVNAISLFDEIASNKDVIYKANFYHDEANQIIKNIFKRKGAAV